MTGALLRLVRRVGAQLGSDAAEALLRAVRAWITDPASAAGVERYRPSVASWERELMAARYAIPQEPSGERRAAALDAYLSLTDAAPGLADTAKDPTRARRGILTALELEARMLRAEALGPGERQAALAANARAHAAVLDRVGQPVSATSANGAERA